MSHESLDSVTKAFEDWRTTRKTHTRIPKPLLEMIRALKNVPPQKIASALKLECPRVEKILGQTQTIDFIQISNKMNSRSSCVFQRSDGTQATVFAEMTQINALIQTFLCYK